MRDQPSKSRYSDRWGDWGLSLRVAAPFGMSERGVLSGHKHREGAAMNHYAGLDVSLEETAICVVDETGQILKEVRAPSEPEALIIALRAIDLPLERVGLEACSLT